MFNARAYSASSATSPLTSTTITRRDPTEHDVQIEILFCGICHSDLHQVRRGQVDGSNQFLVAGDGVAIRHARDEVADGARLADVL